MLHQKLFSILLVATALLFLPFQPTAQIIYVDSSVAVSGNGSSWGNAYKELRDAMTAVQNNMVITQINIAKGTYKPRYSINKDSAFLIFRGNIRMYGGFPNGGGIRNINAHKVVLSGSNSDPVYTSYHILVIAGLSAGADSVIVDGVTFSDGYADNAGHNQIYNGQTIDGNKGSGICLQNNWSGSNIVVRNCTFTNNTGNSGAGIYSYSTGTLSVEHCSFIANIGMGGPSAGTNSYGAGLYNYQTTATISDCSFSDNSFNRSGWGIGIYNENASIAITNTSFTNNSGPANGGAMANVNGGVADISYCTFTDNSIREFAYGYLGLASGVYNLTSSINLHHSTFVGNTSYGAGVLLLSSSPVATIDKVSMTSNINSNSGFISNGGAISIVDCSPVISNCLFAKNITSFSGTLYCSNGANPLVSNCTFYRNLADMFSGAVYCADSSGGSYRNCIFWEDTTYMNYNPGRREIVSMNNGSNPAKPSPSVSFSIVNSPFPMLNVIDSGSNSNGYPLFVDTANIAGNDGLYGTADDGLRLQPCSPGIDAGINSAIPAGVTKDLKDDNRISNGAVDIGAYENPAAVVSNATIIANDGDSVYRTIYGSADLLSNCQLIARIVPSGASPVAGGVKAKVTIDNSGSLFTNPYVQRYYDIEPAYNAAAATAIITLYFTQADFDAYNIIRGTYPSLPEDAADVANLKANIVVHQLHGTGSTGTETTITPTGVVWNSTNNWWEVSFPVTGFSRFYLNSSLIALPVVLEYFKGQQQPNRIYLTWKADCSNASLLSANLQKSIDGNIFATIYEFNATGQRCQLPFAYTDAGISTNNYYRVKLTETGGKIIYSNTLYFNGGKLNRIVVNPVVLRQGQSLNITVPQKDYTLAIYNSTGALIKQQLLLQDNNTISPGLGAGIYFYRVANSSQQVQKTGMFIVE